MKWLKRLYKADKWKKNWALNFYKTNRQILIVCSNAKAELV